MKVRSEAQSNRRQMKDAWWAAKAEELQGYADQHSTRLFFPGLTAVYGPPTSAMTPIRASDATPLTEKAHTLERWTAHISQLLNKTYSRPIAGLLTGCCVKHSRPTDRLLCKT